MNAHPFEPLRFPGVVLRADAALDGGNVVPLPVVVHVFRHDVCALSSGRGWERVLFLRVLAIPERL